VEFIECGVEVWRFLVVCVLVCVVEKGKGMKGERG